MCTPLFSDMVPGRFDGQNHSRPLGPRPRYNENQHTVSEWLRNLEADRSGTGNASDCVAEDY